MANLIPSDVPESELRLYRLSDDIATRILEILHKQDLTQDQLAEKLGKHKSYVSRVISGGVNLTLRTIAEFESALGTEILHVPTDEKRRLALARVWASAEVETYTERPMEVRLLAGFESVSSVSGRQTDVQDENVLVSSQWPEDVHWSSPGSSSTSPIDGGGTQDPVLRAIYQDNFGTPNPPTD
jgi:transcriptional regulator with XRE-family HTH domain